MIKNNNRKIIPLTLILLLVIFVDLLFATEAKKAMALKTIDEEAILNTEAFVVERPQVAYSVADLRDPFLTSIPVEVGGVPKNKEEEKLPVLTVQGLIFGPKFPQVIINNKVLKVGDQISGVTVTGISKDEVAVLFSEKYYNLVAPAAVVKTSQIQGGKK